MDPQTRIFQLDTVDLMSPTCTWAGRTARIGLNPAELTQTVTKFAVGTAHPADFLPSERQPMPDFGSSGMDS